MRRFLGVFGVFRCCSLCVCVRMNEEGLGYFGVGLGCFAGVSLLFSVCAC